MVKLDFQYNVLEGALISALYPLIWGPSLTFLIYATMENAACKYTKIKRRSTHIAVKMYNKNICLIFRKLL